MPDDDLRAQILAELEPTIKKGQLLDQLDADPKFRGPLRTMVATKFPDTAATMPETAVAAAVEPTLAMLRATNDELQKRLAADQQMRDRAGFAHSLRLAGIADRDLAVAFKLAEERSTLDPQALAYLVKESKQAAAPTAGWGRPSLPGHGKNTGDYWSGKGTGSPSITEDPQGWALARAEKDWHAVQHRLPLDPIDA